MTHEKQTGKPNPNCKLVDVVIYHDGTLTTMPDSPLLDVKRPAPQKYAEIKDDSFPGIKIFRGQDLPDWFRNTETLDEVSWLLDRCVRMDEVINKPFYSAESIERMVRDRVNTFRRADKKIPEPPKNRDLQDWQEWFTARDKVTQPKADNATENNTEQSKPQKKIKEPSKEATQAFFLYYGTTCKTQEDVAKIMTNELKKPVSQGQVSRLLTKYKKWREAEGIPVDDTRPNIIVNTNILDMGARTDGRTTGDPRHKAKVDPDGIPD